MDYIFWAFGDEIKVFYTDFIVHVMWAVLGSVTFQDDGYYL